jgi:hypothetical protein
MIRSMTNIPMVPERKIVRLSDPGLFESPFLLVKGSAALRLSKDDKSHLKQFIDRGGFVFFDDTLGDPRGEFSKSVRATLGELYPDRSLQKLSADHAVFRSFFLMRNAAGRRMADKQLEGLDIGGGAGGEGRTAVIYSANDMEGAWVRDNFGKYAYPCEPGGEPQRWETFKLTLNIIYFALTGTYKKDAIHQPFIERKLGT